MGILGACDPGPGIESGALDDPSILSTWILGIEGDTEESGSAAWRGAGFFLRKKEAKAGIPEMLKDSKVL